MSLREIESSLALTALCTKICRYNPKTGQLTTRNFLHMYHSTSVHDITELYLEFLEHK